MNFEQELPALSRSEMITQRASVISRLTENEKINFAGEGLYEYENIDALEGIRHHQERLALQTELEQLNEKLNIVKFSREEVVD